MPRYCILLQSLSSYKSCLFDSGGLVLLQYFTLCGSYTFPPFPWGTLSSDSWEGGAESGGEEDVFSKDILYALCLAVGLCISSHLLQKEASLMMSQ